MVWPHSKAVRKFYKLVSILNHIIKNLHNIKELLNLNKDFFTDLFLASSLLINIKTIIYNQTANCFVGGGEDREQGEEKDPFEKLRDEKRQNFWSL